MTALAKAKRDLSFTRVVAPFDGVVGNKAAEVGNFVQPGTRLMALVPLNASYVDANFKETQLADIKPGQKVDVAIDALDGKTVEGVVSSISPASGSEFSLLPPDNATGNFTKVVQRVAVRITFPEDVLKEVPLRPGLSVVATVHTRDPDAPKPTLLGALGLEALATQDRQAVSDARARSGRPRRAQPTPGAPRRAAGLRRPAFLDQAARGLHLHGVRDVHGHPGHPDRVGLAVADPGRPLGLVGRDHLGPDEPI